MPASYIGGGAQLLSGIVGDIVGAGQKKQGNRILGGLTYPTEAIPQAIIENQDEARQRANQGLPSAQYNKAMQDIQRQQMAAIYGTQSKRGGLSTIADVQKNTNDATLNLDAKDAQQRIANQNNLQEVNNAVGGWQDKVWDNNVKQKYLQNYNYAMGLIGAGNQNQSNGIDKGIAGAGLGIAGLAGVRPQQYYPYSGGYGGGSYGGQAQTSTAPTANYY